MGKVIRPFCSHQNFVHWGLSAPAPGLHTCINSWKKKKKKKKKCIKSDTKEIFLKLARNDQSDKMFLLTSKFRPQVTPNQTSKTFFFFLYRLEMTEILLKGRKTLTHPSIHFFFIWNLQQMTEVTRHFCWHQNFVPWGLSAPVPGLHTCICAFWRFFFVLPKTRTFFLRIIRVTFLAL